MAPKKAGGSSKAGEGKRKVVRKTIELKKKLIAKYESGVPVSVLAKEFGLAKSTISTILYKSCFLDLERIKIIYINSNAKKLFRFSNKSLFEQPSETDYVGKPRFNCTISKHVNFCK